VFGDSQKAQLQTAVEKYLLAKYFVDNTVVPGNELVKDPGNVQRLDRYRPNLWSDTRGTVPERIFAPTIFSQATLGFMKSGIDRFFVSPLERKLVDLDILRKVPSESAVAAWVPGASAVLYHSIDVAARGRIAEWAARYLAGDPVSAMTAPFMRPEHAARVRQLQRLWAPADR
jgi:hypothetical protein